jgi:pyridinium-3,5-bisthiocarboxylic acid mononucleotide nickel chelatase
MSDLIIESLDMLETDLDDESPEVLGYLIGKALKSGALDATLSPVFMKKNRPGTRVEVLCRPEDRETLVRMLLQETSTLGVRVRQVERYCLPREFGEVTVRDHPIRVKKAFLDGKLLRVTPEFEDCKKLAEKLGVPLRDMMEEARSKCECNIS